MLKILSLQVFLLTNPQERQAKIMYIIFAFLLSVFTSTFQERINTSVRNVGYVSKGESDFSSAVQTTDRDLLGSCLTLRTITYF